MDVPNTFAELVVWIGTPFFANGVLSLLAEWLPAWHGLSAGVKKAVVILVPVLLAVLSYLANQQGVIEFLSEYDPLLQAVVFALAGVVGGQWWHEYWNKPNETKPDLPVE